MPKVRFEGAEYDVEEGERLRDALRSRGAQPHNGESRWFNCKGFGTCGTCAVRVVSGDAGPMTGRERWRLGFPPHERVEGMRLACQVRVRGDLELEKHPGFWGHLTDEGARGEQPIAPADIPVEPTETP